MSRRPYEYLLSIGSNIEPERWVPFALASLRARFEVVAASGRYDVPAVGGGAQPPFVNLAARVRTDLPPPALREACRSLETLCGRVRTADPCAPRTLDVDVVYGASDWPPAEGLPHPDLARESYVLVPCAEIWPEARIGAPGRTLGELAAANHPGWAAAHRRREET